MKTTSAIASLFLTGISRRGSDLKTNIVNYYTTTTDDTNFRLSRGSERSTRTFLCTVKDYDFDYRD